MYVSLYKDILFIEGEITEAAILHEVSVTIKGVLIHAQLKSLDHVKDELVQQVSPLGANAVVQFTYGQKSASFWQSLLSLDDVHWYGAGKAARLRPEVYNELVRSLRDF